MEWFYYENAREPWKPDDVLRRFLSNQQPAYAKATAGRSRAKALDLGMGYGRNAIWLAEQGYEVEGWEREARYVAEARSRWKTCNVQRATDVGKSIAKLEARNPKLGDGKLVVRKGDFTRGGWRGPYEVIVISQALHQVRRSVALQVLERAKKALAPGGRFFLLAKLTSDRHVQWVRRNPGWKPVPGERNTFLRPEARKRGHYHRGRPRPPAMLLSALEPKEIRLALKGLKLRHWRTVVLRSDWEEEPPVTHTVAEVVAEKRKSENRMEKTEVSERSESRK